MSQDNHDADAGNNVSAYTPTWHEFMRDMHAMDKRVTLLESALLQQAKTMGRMEEDAKIARDTLIRIDNQLTGWKGSITVIVAASGTLVAFVLFILDKMWH